MPLPCTMQQLAAAWRRMGPGMGLGGGVWPGRCAAGRGAGRKGSQRLLHATVPASHQAAGCQCTGRERGGQQAGAGALWAAGRALSAPHCAPSQRSSSSCSCSWGQQEGRGQVHATHAALLPCWHPSGASGCPGHLYSGGLHQQGVCRGHGCACAVWQERWRSSRGSSAQCCCCCCCCCGNSCRGQGQWKGCQEGACCNSSCSPQCGWWRHCSSWHPSALLLLLLLLPGPPPPAGRQRAGSQCSSGGGRQGLQPVGGLHSPHPWAPAAGLPWPGGLPGAQRWGCGCWRLRSPAGCAHTGPGPEPVGGGLRQALLQGVHGGCAV